MEREVTGKGPPTERVVFAAAACGRKGKLFQVADQTDRVQVQLQSPFSKIKMLMGKQPRAFFGGVDELGKPGSICLHMFPSFKKS